MMNSSVYITTYRRSILLLDCVILSLSPHWADPGGKKGGGVGRLRLGRSIQKGFPKTKNNLCNLYLQFRRLFIIIITAAAWFI
jgi:hypothetical protein